MDGGLGNGLAGGTSLAAAPGVDPRDALFWYDPLTKPHFLGGRSSGAIRHGDWKLIKFFDTGEVELYNPADDLGEQHNLAKSHPDRVAHLKRLLKDWRKMVEGRDAPPR